MQVCVDNHHCSQESLVFPPSVNVLRLYIYLLFCCQAVYNMKPTVIIHTWKYFRHKFGIQSSIDMYFLNGSGKLGGGGAGGRLKFFLEMISNIHTKNPYVFCFHNSVGNAGTTHLSQPSSVFSCRAPPPSRHLVTSFTIVTAPHLSLFANI